MTRFTEYHDAVDYAREQATALGLPMVIRGKREYGKLGYNVNIKSNDGSDYLGETVEPGTPKSERRGKDVSGI